MARHKYKSARIKNPVKPAISKFDIRSPNAVHLHAFRTDDELADLLNSQDNKSEIIVRALREFFARESCVVCPTCKGVGEVFNPEKFDRMYKLKPVLITGNERRQLSNQ